MDKGNWVVAALVLVTTLAAGQDYRHNEKSTVRDSFSFPAGVADIEVSVDNIEGAITVSGSPGRRVELTALQTILADSPARLQLAKEEIQLKITKRDSLFEAYVDAPWRCKDARKGSEWRDRGYRVQIDFELSVPPEARLFLRTINHGEIKVAGVNGDFDVKNINGGIEMLDAGGSGNAYAVNGKVAVSFRNNPVRASSFGSLNGDVDLYFRPGLAADLRLKTFNGDVYSDFDVTPLPSAPMVRVVRDGKQMYKSDKFLGVRVGRGGPEIKLDGFNGDIRIHERKE
jgi:hypothetical protein